MSDDSCAVLQDMANDNGGHVQTDASGNPILKDIGLFLRGVFRKELNVSPLSTLACRHVVDTSTPCMDGARL